MKEIIIKLPRPVTTDEIKLVSSEEIKAHYKAIGKNVPFQWVLIPYVEIDGKDYAVIVKEVEKDNFTQVVTTGKRL